jgi:hypothetical protein
VVGPEVEVEPAVVVVPPLLVVVVVAPSLVQAPTTSVNIATEVASHLFDVIAEPPGLVDTRLPGRRV